MQVTSKLNGYFKPMLELIRSGVLLFGSNYLYILLITPMRCVTENNLKQVYGDNHVK